MAERCVAISDNLGQTVLLGDTGAGDYAGSIFAKLGYYFRDGRYLFMLDKRGSLGYSTDEPLRNFAAGIAPEVPADHVGLKVIPADDLFFRTALQRKTGVDFKNAFDKLTLRSGFDPNDEYLLLDGTAGGSHSYDDANSLGEFSANGRRWLCEIDIFNGPTMSFHNAVTVARAGLGEPDVPQAAELVTSARGDGYAYTATRLPHYNHTAWTRHLLWLPGRYTFAWDELTAEEAGEYSFVLGWRSLGQPSLRPGRFISAQDERKQAGLVFDGPALVKSVSANSGKVLYLLSGYNALFYRADQPGDFVEVVVKGAAGGRVRAGHPHPAVLGSRDGPDEPRRTSPRAAARPLHGWRTSSRGGRRGEGRSHGGGSIGCGLRSWARTRPRRPTPSRSATWGSTAPASAGARAGLAQPLLPALPSGDAGDARSGHGDAGQVPAAQPALRPGAQHPRAEPEPNAEGGGRAPASRMLSTPGSAPTGGVEMKRLKRPVRPGEVRAARLRFSGPESTGPPCN